MKAPLEESGSAAAMTPSALLSSIQDLYTSFNPKVQTLDSYIEDKLGDCDSERADPDKVFIKQVGLANFWPDCSVEAAGCSPRCGMFAGSWREDYLLPASLSLSLSL